MGRIGARVCPPSSIANCLAINAAKMRCLGRGANIPVNAQRAAPVLCVIGTVPDRRQVAATEISRHTVKDTELAMAPPCPTNSAEAR